MITNRYMTSLTSKRVLVACVAMLATSLGSQAFAQDYGFSETAAYSMTTVSGAGTDISAGFVDSSGLADDDNGFQDVALPFDFDFFGTTFTQGTMVRVFVNGFVSFDTTATASGSLTNNVSLNSANAPSNSVYVFWDTVASLSGTGGQIFTHTQMNGNGNMEFVIEWFNCGNGLTAGFWQGQVAFEQTTNKIFLRYDPGYNDGGNLVSYGLKSSTGVIRGYNGGSSTGTQPNGNAEFTPAANLVDLEVANATVSVSGNVQVGQSVDVSFTLNNNTANTSTLFDCALVLSTDATIDSNDQVIGTFTGPNAGQFMLNGNDTTSVMGTFTIPTPNPMAAGRGYFLGILADSMGTQVDLDASDNSFGQVIQIGDPLYLVRTEAKTGYTSIMGDPNTTVVADGSTNNSTGGEIAINAPFDFGYFGSTVSTGAQCAIGYNGYLALDRTVVNTSTAFGETNRVIPDAVGANSPDNAIFLFWDDIAVNTSGVGQILSLVSGTAPNRTWTVEFNQLSRDFSSTLGYSGQIVIEEGSGIIRLKYDENLPFPSGTTASIGIEDSAGLDGIDLTGLGTGNSTQPATNFLLLPNGVQSFDIDIVTSNVSVAQTMINASETIDVTRTFMNTAGGDAGAFEVTFVLSDDQIFDSNDMVMSTVTIPGLSAGQTLTETTAVPVPTATPAGMYFVGVLANTATNVVLETDFFNNEAGTSTAIQVDAPGRDQGNVNGDLAIDVADVMFAINIAISATPGQTSADLNNDNVVDILDIQLIINRVLNAP